MEPQEKDLSLMGRLKEKAIKTMEKATADATMQKLQAGQNPDDILSQLTKMASQQVPVEGTQVGIVPALINMVKGQGFNPMAPQTQSLGMDKAATILGLQMQADKAGIEQRKEARQVPMDQAAFLKSIVDLVEKSGNPQLAKSFGLDPGMINQSAVDDREIRKATLTEARKNLNEFSVTATKGMASLDKLENAAILLGDFEEGFFNQVGARTDATIQAFAKSPEYTRFIGVMNQELSNLARNLTGEKGPLTDTDIDRIRKGLGDVTVPIRQKLELLDELRNPLGDELEARLAAAEVDERSFRKRFPKVKEGIDKARKRSEERASSRVLTAEQAKQMGADEFDTETGEFFKNGKVIGRKS